MTDLQLDHDDLVVLARREGRSTRDIARILEGRRGVDTETAARIYAAALAIHSRLAPSQRIRRVDPRELGFGAVLDRLDRGRP